MSSNRHAALLDVVAFLVGILIALVVVLAAYGQVPESCRRYQGPLTAAAHDAFGLNAPISTLAAQIQQESGCRPDALSPVGAQGLSQFMPATAKDLAARYPRELGPADPFDWRWAIRAQVRYMRDLVRTPWMNRCSTWSAKLSAYNGGEGWLQRDQKVCKGVEVSVNGQMVPCHLYLWDRFVAVTPDTRRAASNVKENRDYVRRIMTLESSYRSAGYGADACGP